MKRFIAILLCAICSWAVPLPAAALIGTDPAASSASSTEIGASTQQQRRAHPVSERTAANRATGETKPALVTASISKSTFPSFLSLWYCLLPPRAP